jgi:hypothetical protein
MKFGNITLIGTAEVQNFVAQRLATDPVSPRDGQIWFNTTEATYKFFDGTEVFPFAKGGDLDNYLLRDGTDAGMTGELVLNSNDQTGASSDRVATSKGYVDAGLGAKQDTITGAATTIVDSDLQLNRVVTTDGSGKIADSEVTTAELGHLTGVTAPIQAQIDGKEDALGYVPVNKDGDSMNGNLALQGNRVIGLGAPVDANDAARKVDLDNAIANLNWQDDVDGVQTDNTLDPGASPTAGVRYIITDSANLNANFGTITGVEDGDIVQFDGTEFVVAFDVSDPALEAAGTLAADTANGVYMRYNGSAWATFDGLDSLVAGIGLVKSGNVIDVNLGAGIGELPSDEVGIDLRAASGLALLDPTTGDASVDAAAQLAILLDGASLQTGVDGLSIAPSGVTETEVASSALGNGLTGGAGVALSVVPGTGVVVDGSGVSFDETYGDGRYVNGDGDTMTGPLILSADPTALLEATTKQYVDAADAALQQSIDDANARIGNGHFVYDGTASVDGTHTVVHNIGSQFVNVTVIDSANEMIIPDTVTFDSANQLTVTLSQALGVRVVVSGAVPES